MENGPHGPRGPTARRRAQEGPGSGFVSARVALTAAGNVTVSGRKESTATLITVRVLNFI